MAASARRFFERRWQAISAVERSRKQFMRRLLPLIAFAILLNVPLAARAGEALVAVAANYAGAAEAIAKAFSEKTGHKVAFTTGATGKLYAQISEGAPFDALLSADAKTPEKIEADGNGVAGTRFTYAIGRLALWSADAGRIGPDAKAALTDPGTVSIAIANPDLAPYGVAARQALQSMGLWDAIQPKIVMGQNIGQAFAMTESGAAQIGFVALSAVKNPDKPAGGSLFEIPQEWFEPIRQDAILLKKGENSEAAKAFLEFLKGPQAREISARFGYGGP
jgi:molybdate transport system substrate-binding protein